MFHVAGGTVRFLCYVFWVAVWVEAMYVYLDVLWREEQGYVRYLSAGSGDGGGDDTMPQPCRLPSPYRAPRSASAEENPDDLVPGPGVGQ